ncbi:DNA recombination protein RmuC, partial [Muriicola sp.]
MSTEITLLVVALLAILVGFFLGIYIERLKRKSIQSTLEERERQLGKNREELELRLSGEKQVVEDLRTENSRLNQLVTRNEADLENLRQKLEDQKEEVADLQEKFTKEFENLANKILDEKSLKFTEQNQKNIKHILNPLQEKIQLFEKKVEESQKENISIHSALREQLLNLQNQNLKITKEAENLTKALKGDSKMQGNWGELVLEKVLEKSGLEKDREYTVQK